MDREGNFLFRLSFLLLVLGLGCAGSPKPKDAPEFSSELPSEYKKKFDISQVKPDSRPIAPLTSKKKRQPKKQKETPERAPSNQGFVYPTRRPQVDPIWVGEKLSYAISYLNIQAGYLTLEALPFKWLGDRKTYHIQGLAESSAIFSIFYRLKDTVETYFDYEGNFSHRFHIVLDETKQQRDSLELNDSEKQETFFWNRWHHHTAGYREVKETKPMTPFAQDSLSALYYVRTIPLPVGEVITFPIVSEGKSWEVQCTVVRKENRLTPFGDVPTIVLKPEMKYQGILQQKNGDSFLWLTDDERRFPVRLEAKVRIGTLAADLIDAELGNDPKTTQ